MLSLITILGIKITSNPKAEILAFIVNHLRSQKVSKPLKIYTPNPEQIVYAYKHPEFREVLNSADINLPDGIGIVWAARLVQSSKLKVRSNDAHEKLRTPQRIPGIEFMEELVNVAAEKNWPVAFIGGRYGVAEQALDNLKQKYPGLEGWAEDGPDISVQSSKFKVQSYNPSQRLINIRGRGGVSENEYWNQLVKHIHESKTRFVFVGLGAPKQEYFIGELSSKLEVRSKEETTNYEPRTTNSVALMSVGGAFDIVSGKLPRVPGFLHNIEFVWRLILEPWRIKRHFALLWFIILVLVRKSGSHSNS